MALSKQTGRELYRPTGPKVFIQGANTPSLQTGGQLNYTQSVDLSLPIRGFQFSFYGRDTIVTGMDPNHLAPEGFLNFVTNITIQGVNARQQGNITLYNLSLSDIYDMSFLTANQGTGTYKINTNTAGSALTLVPRPTEPYGGSATLSVNGNPTEGAGAFDWQIILTLPLGPFAMNGFGKSPMVTPFFGMRNEEWKDSVTISLTFAGQPNGALAGPLGVGLAGTTHTFSSFGSSTGSPQIDFATIPFLSGLTSKDSYLPAVYTRVSQPLSSVLQNNGSNVTLMNLQKQPTGRVYMKTGTSTVNGVFQTLSDTIVTSWGIFLGGNRNIRNNVNIHAIKADRAEEYQVGTIQGWSMNDFIQNGNYDSNFAGQDIGDGATFTINGNIIGTPNAAADVVQEQILHLPAGPLAQ